MARLSGCNSLENQVQKMFYFFFFFLLLKENRDHQTSWNFGQENQAARWRNFFGDRRATTALHPTTNDQRKSDERRRSVTNNSSAIYLQHVFNTQRPFSVNIFYESMSFISCTGEATKALQVIPRPRSPSGERGTRTNLTQAKRLSWSRGGGGSTMGPGTRRKRLMVTQVERRFGWEIVETWRESQKTPARELEAWQKNIYILIF